jgi:hypothetical protein
MTINSNKENVAAEMRIFLLIVSGIVLPPAIVALKSLSLSIPVLMFTAVIGSLVLGYFHMRQLGAPLKLGLETT